MGYGAMQVDIWPTRLRCAPGIGGDNRVCGLRRRLAAAAVLHRVGAQLTACRNKQLGRGLQQRGIKRKIRRRLFTQKTLGLLRQIKCRLR